MRMYECENCHSLFVINEADTRVRGGDYIPNAILDCPLCSAGMIRIDRKEKKEEDDAVPSQNWQNDTPGQVPGIKRNPFRN